MIAAANGRHSGEANSATREAETCDPAVERRRLLPTSLPTVGGDDWTSPSPMPSTAIGRERLRRQVARTVAGADGMSRQLLRLQREPQLLTGLLPSSSKQSGAPS